MISDIFIGIALGALVWGVVSALAVTSYLSRKGVKINWIFLKLMIIKYLHQYYEITVKEDGKPGPWFYSYISAMNIALVTAIIGLLLKR